MNNQQTKAEDEIDLLELVSTLWNARKSIFKFTILFFIIGVLIAIFSGKEYTAKTIMIPQTSDEKISAGGLGGLAAMAGINLGGNTTEAIPITTYPKIVSSVPFKQKMLKTLLSFENLEKGISYENYYAKYVKPSALTIIKKYTIGLPSLLLSKREEEIATESTDSNPILKVSNKERAILSTIDNQLKIEINEKEGIITLSYTMSEALPAAQMLQRAQTLLQETITEFKIQKATEELNFIKQRHQEAEKDFKAKQFALAQFQDRNRDLFGSLPQTRLQQLQTDFNLSFNVYSELSKQLESKQIKVKEEQPIFTIIEPVTVPNEPSKPRRAMIVAIWTFMGIVFGIGGVFIKDFVKKVKQRKTENE